MIPREEPPFRMPSGKRLRRGVFPQILKIAMKLLSDEDAIWLEDQELTVKTGWAFVNNGERIYAEGIHLPDCGNSVIVLHANAILHQALAKRYPYSQIVDWVRRLLQHEIGHMRDHRTDAEMAGTDHY